MDDVGRRIEELDAKLTRSQFARNHPGMDEDGVLTTDEHFKTWDEMWDMLKAKERAGS